MLLRQQNGTDDQNDDKKRAASAVNTAADIAEVFMASGILLQNFQTLKEIFGQIVILEPQLIVISRHLGKSTVVGQFSFNASDKLLKFPILPGLLLLNGQKFFHIPDGLLLFGRQMHRRIAAKGLPAVKKFSQTDKIPFHTAILHLTEFVIDLSGKPGLLQRQQTVFDLFKQFRLGRNPQFRCIEFPVKPFQSLQFIFIRGQLRQSLFDLLKAAPLGRKQIVEPAPGIGQFFNDLSQKSDPFLFGAVPGDLAVILQKRVKVLVSAGNRRA